MSRNNIKLLTDEQLFKLNSKYIFDVEEDCVVVTINGYDRITRHPFDKPFEINSQSTVKRKVTFTVEAINIWLELREKYDCSLFDVQQAINILTLSYQKIDKDAVLKRVKSPSVKIQRI